MGHLLAGAGGCGKRGPRGDGDGCGVWDEGCGGGWVVGVEEGGRGASYGKLLSKFNQLIIFTLTLSGS